MYLDLQVRSPTRTKEGTMADRLAPMSSNKQDSRDTKTVRQGQTLDS